MRVAHIIKVTAQDRPYRTGLPAGKFPEFLRDLARQGRAVSDLMAIAAGDLRNAMGAVPQSGLSSAGLQCLRSTAKIRGPA